MAGVALAAIVLLGGCSEDEEQYCEVLAEEQETLTALADVTETDWVLVPALGSLVLPEDRGPRIRLRNLPTNQDFCKSKSFDLTYSGTASN